VRVSRRLRAARKATARLTGLHGLLSRKPSKASIGAILEPAGEEAMLGKGEMDAVRTRIAAIDRAREGVERAIAADSESRRRRGFFGGRRRRQEEDEMSKLEASVEVSVVREKTALELMDEERRIEEERKRIEEEEQRKKEAALEEERRMERVKQIDNLIAEAQSRLLELACEKDDIQRRPNPLWKYTTETTPTTNGVVGEDEASSLDADLGIQRSRKFNFPPEDLVDEYLDMIFSSRRLTQMNHTLLWQDKETMDEDDDDDTIGYDLLTPSADAHKLYEQSKDGDMNGKHKNGGAGSWLLRQNFAGGRSLGEKIGEAAETAAYKAVCTSLMSFLARSLSSIHGINVMTHSDIRLVLEQAPDLPPMGEGVIPGSSANYAQETINTVMRRKSKKQKKRSKLQSSEDSFVQRDAVTEMLLSHCQISAPLLKLFPLAWQRALLGNIITLSTAVMSDFFDGLQFQILGHQLSFAFKPITEADMINHLGLAGGGFNHRRARPEEFEAAVRATAEDVSEELKFLDKWHERALGSGVLRTQIANLIARIVLTLTDEVLSGARIDLWSAQAGGPRMLAGLEYRT
jgi:hypothetical protein